MLTINDKIGDLASRVTTYPNPATHEASVELENAGVGEVTITLYNQAGKAVLLKKIKAATNNLQTQLEISQLKRGNYILVITTPNGISKQHLYLQ